MQFLPLAELTNVVKTNIRLVTMKKIVNTFDASLVGAKSPNPTVLTVADMKNKQSMAAQPS